MNKNSFMNIASSRNIIKNHCLVNLKQYILFSHNVSTKVSPYSIEYLIIKRFSGSGSGKKIAKEVAKAASPKVSPQVPPDVATMSHSPKPIIPVATPEASYKPKNLESGEKPENLKSKFLSSTDVTFLQDNIKKNHPDMENIELQVSTQSTVASTPILLGVNTEKEHFIMDSTGKITQISKEEHVYVAVQKENGSKEIIGTLTSSHGNTANSQDNNPRISDKKFDGSFTPIRNPKSNMNDFGFAMSKDVPATIVTDNYGNRVPSPTKGGQCMRVNSESYIATPEEQKFLDMQENPEATTFLEEEPVRSNILRIFKKQEEKNEKKIILSKESRDKLIAEEEKEQQTKVINENTQVVSDTLDEINNYDELD